MFIISFLLLASGLQLTVDANNTPYLGYELELIYPADLAIDIVPAPDLENIRLDDKQKRHLFAYYRTALTTDNVSLNLTFDTLPAGDSINCTIRFYNNETKIYESPFNFNFRNPGSGSGGSGNRRHSSSAISEVLSSVPVGVIEPPRLDTDSGPENKSVDIADLLFSNEEENLSALIEEDALPENKIQIDYRRVIFYTLIIVLAILLLLGNHYYQKKERAEHEFKNAIHKL